MEPLATADNAHQGQPKGGAYGGPSRPPPVAEANGGWTGVAGTNPHIDTVGPAISPLIDNSGAGS